MKKIAVTGGVATGKSTACQILKDLGAYVISADEIVHQILSPENDIGKKVIALLGCDIVSDGVIRRERVSEAIFRNNSLLNALEELLHPEVQKVIDSQYHEISSGKYSYPLFVAEVPLLFEAQLEKYYDAILLIISDEALCQMRFMNKGFSKLEYEKRQKRFFSVTEKSQKSNFSVKNNGSYDDFKASIINIYQELIKGI